MTYSYTIYAEGSEKLKWRYDIKTEKASGSCKHGRPSSGGITSEEFVYLRKY
jgi:hypothetical protein